MTPTQSLAVESNANIATIGKTNLKALSATQHIESRDRLAWLELQEELELDFIRAETLNKGRAFANNHHEEVY